MLTQEVIVETPARKGALSSMFTVLSRARIETLGVSTETFEQAATPWRRVRFLFREATEGAAALKHEGFSVRVLPVLYLQVEASVGRLDWAIGKLTDAGIHVDALYHAYAPGGPGLVVACENPEKAAEVL